MLVTPEAGDKVDDRYVLQEAIGRGGMGVVWKAWDELLARQVAVKCARPDDARATQRLMREARNAARLHHPNIVAVFDYVIQGDACWIVMEYVPSRSLAQLVAEHGLLTPDETGSIGSQIADALVKSHEEGVVHGDVTPENILVTKEGVARLTDFGISRALWSDVTQATTTTTGTVRGKPRYLAPEVAKGQAADKEADVFSLGASLFVAVEGHSPYGEFEHLMGYLAKAVEGHVEAPRRAGRLTEPLTTLLAVEPRRRPDAAEAHRLLTRAAPPPAHIQKYLQEHGRVPTHEERREDRTLDLTPATLPSPEPVRRSRRRWAIAVVASTAAAALAAGLVVLGPWSSDGDRGGKAGAEGTASGDAQTAAQAGAMGDARTADPCKLLNAASLGRFGDTRLDPDYGDLNRCDVLVEGSGEDVADVQVVLENGTEDVDGSANTRRVGNVEIATTERNGDGCVRFIATSDRQEIVVIGERLESGSPDPCQLADAATDYAASVLDKGPVPPRSSSPAADSLSRLDACTLLDPTALKRVPGIEERPSDHGFGDWNCTWESSKADVAYVQLKSTQDNDLSDNGEPTSIAGTTGYVSPKEEGDDSCVVYTPHRTYTNSVGDRTVELFRLTVREQQQSSRKVCDTAKALAATAVKSIAKQLPEGK